VTPFVRADDENDGTVAPPQGLEFFEDVNDGDYYDGVGVHMQATISIYGNVR